MFRDKILYESRGVGSDLDCRKTRWESEEDCLSNHSGRGDYNGDDEVSESLL